MATEPKDYSLRGLETEPKPPIVMSRGHGASPLLASYVSPVEGSDLMFLESGVALSPMESDPQNLPTPTLSDTSVLVVHGPESTDFTDASFLPQPTTDASVVQSTGSYSLKDVIFQLGWNVRGALSPPERPDVEEGVENAVEGGEGSLAREVMEAKEDQGLARFGPRLGWLMGLLLVQSISSAVLTNYQSMIEKHTAVVFFLTMLIGAGGNSGSQSCILVIRALGKGPLTSADKWRILGEQFAQGLTLGVALALFSILRVLPFDSNLLEVAAICVSLFIIIVVSTIVASALPLLLDHFKVDPGHAAAAVQVMMDIIGVCIVMTVCSVILGNQ